jgi:hypothetical protein
LADALAAAFIAQVGDCKLHLFIGTQPATSTALAGALTGYTRLITYQATVVQTAKYPINWDSVTTGSGIAKRLMSESVQGVAAASGNATWGCITNVDDALGAGSSKRYAFSVGTSGADVNLTNVAFLSGTTYPFTSALEVPELLISAALAAAITGPSITYQNIVADGGGKYGINWDSVTASSGIAKRLSTDGVQGVAAEAALLTYVVIANIDDTLAASSSAKRILLTVGTAGSGAGVTLTDLSLVNGTTYPFLAALNINVGNTA